MVSPTITIPENVVVYELRREETGILSILKGGEVIETFEPNQEEDARERLKELTIVGRKGTLSAWLNEGWRVSKKGNEHKDWDRFHLVVYKKNDKWTGRLTDIITKRCMYAKSGYATHTEVKIAAFDAATSWRKKLNQTR